jgi:basic amino acid/polyamine antiporter, APA family
MSSGDTTATESGRTAAGASPRAFTRASSGLVRDLSLVDIAWYGIFAAGSLYLFIYLFPFPQFASPGVSMPLLLVFLLLYAIPVYYVYAALGSAMLRAGGDYLYQSRAISPLVGFVAPWACELLFWLTYPASGGFVVAQFGLEPLFAQLGRSYDINWCTRFANWLGTSTGTFTVTVIMVGCCWLLTVARLKTYRAVQRRVLVPLTVAAVIAIYVIVFVGLTEDWPSKFAAYSSGAVTVGDITKAAASGGFHRHSLDLWNTFIWVAPIGGIIAYSMFSAQGLLGEVKNAANTRRLFNAFLIPGIFLAIGMLAIPLLLLTHIVTGTFLDQYALATGNGAVTPPYSSNLSVFFAMLSPSPILTIIMSLGFISAGFGIAMVVFLNSSRVMMAMGLDGALPPLFSKVSDRLHTPVVATTIWSAVAVAVVIVFNYAPDWETPLLLGGTITSVMILGFTAAAASLLPYRAQDIYSSAPSTVRKEVMGVPWITVVGVIAVIATVILTWIALTFQQLGLVNDQARYSLVGAFVTGIVVYYVWRVRERARGVDTGLAFRQVPPD